MKRRLKADRRSERKKTEERIRDFDFISGVKK